MNLLIIEDDLILAQQISRVFKFTWNFNKIKILNSYNQFLREYHLIKSYDIILVDIMLSPNIRDSKNWIEIVRLIRNKSTKVPIIVMSWLTELNWLEKAFWKWINDYLCKPFRLKELEIRVDRWCKTYFYNDLTVKKKISYWPLVKDICQNEFYYNWEHLVLSKNSKFILSLFISSPNKLISEEDLKNRIWWDVASVIERNPRVNVSRLKTSLERYWIWDWIKNIRWEGYVLKK